MSKEVLLDDLFSADAIDGVDINQAFHEAAYGIITDKEIALDAKVARIENIIQEANSDFYREFVDLRSMAAHIEMMCSHDHSLQAELGRNETVGGFMKQHEKHFERDHSDKYRSTAQKQKKGKATKKSKKAKRLTGWALLGIIQKTSR